MVGNDFIGKVRGYDKDGIFIFNGFFFLFVSRFLKMKYLNKILGFFYL